MDLFKYSQKLEEDSQGSDHNVPMYTVTSIAKEIKKVLDGNFSHVKVRGEISGVKKHVESGHIYFSLKDDGAVLNAVCFKGVAHKIPFAIEDGMEVIATGSIGSYASRSNLQIIITFMEVAGQGVLLKQLEDLKKKLESEGLFLPDKKKKIPFLPSSIGIITSETGAVIRDMLHRIEERFPLKVVLYPTLVQGAEAPNQIIKAISYFNSLQENERPDVLIIARGGGSFEDLFCFNNEELARAVHACTIPTISAIGHETDFTIIDYVADLRAPTPTAAAEFAVPVLKDLRSTSQKLQSEIQTKANNFIGRKQDFITILSHKFTAATRLLEKLDKNVIVFAGEILKLVAAAIESKTLRFSTTKEKIVSPAYIYERKLSTLASLFSKTEKATSAAMQNKLARCALLSAKIAIKPEFIESKAAQLQNVYALILLKKDYFIASKQEKIASVCRVLDGYNYTNTVKRGYAVIRTAAGDVVSSVSLIQSGQNLSIELKDGNVNVTVK